MDKTIKKVMCFDIYGEYIMTYDSVIIISKENYCNINTLCNELANGGYFCNNKIFIYETNFTQESLNNLIKKYKIPIIKNEVWKRIDFIDDLNENDYLISNIGRVYSMRKEKIIKPNINQGYFFVGLCEKNKKKYLRIHRLVALAFIPNDDPENKTIVNHKWIDKINFTADTTKQDNRVENLEWCTPGENTIHARDVLKRENFNNNKKCLSKPIYQYNKKGKFIKKYPSLAEIERQLGYKRTAISDVCRGNGYMAYGYYWRYEEEIIKNKINIKEEIKNINKNKFKCHTGKTKSVIQYDLNWNIIKEYSSLSEVGKNGYCMSVVSRCCNGKKNKCYNSYWRYKDYVGNNTYGK